MGTSMEHLQDLGAAGEREADTKPLFGHFPNGDIVHIPDAGTSVTSSKEQISQMQRTDRTGPFLRCGKGKPDTFLTSVVIWKKAVRT